MVVATIVIVLVWLTMVLMVVFAPSGAGCGENRTDIFSAQWGPEPEYEFRLMLRKIPRHIQLTLHDQGEDPFRSAVIERMLIHNQGIVGVRYHPPLSSSMEIIF